MLVTDPESLAARFEQNRAQLRGVAYRMLGSASEADDAVQEAWLRVSRADTGDIGNLGGWLTTVVGRICLDMLRSRKARREDTLEAQHSGRLVSRATPDPEDEAILADSVGSALLVVLQTLAPAERLAFVLHDLFGVPFDQIAAIVARSPEATRQLASRARRRVQGADAEIEQDRNRQREIVDAFLSASRGGDFVALLALLDPDVVLRADGPAVRAGADAEVRGAAGVAQTFAGRARVAQLALVDGAVGAVWVHRGAPRVVFGFTVEDGRIVGIELLADPDVLAGLELEILG
jgi:RNA polymerase sigma factor (sigma-70 family)